MMMVMMKSFLALLLLAASASASGRSYHAPHHHHVRQTNDNTTYDYCVVGSGSGGSPLAARLAMAGFKVLLIEAGGDYYGINQTVPTFSLKSAEDDNIKWDYFVTHYEDVKRQERDSHMTYMQTNGSYYVGKYPPPGAEPLGILYSRSASLGGCAEHHALVSTYPHESDFTYLQTLTGDDSWAPDTMRSYFKKLEKNEYLTLDVSGHGYSGWMKTSLTNLLLVAEDVRILSIVLSAAEAMGKGVLGTLLGSVTSLANVLALDLNADTPGRDQAIGLWQMPLSIDANSSTRSSPRQFVLETANAVNADGSRKYHLDIKLHTLVTKIRFDRSGATPKAIGVEYLSGERLYAADPNQSKSSGTPGYVGASKEVIIAAGTFNSPQILKLSGIGPRDELESFGIEVIEDLPGVGSNMQDRYEISLVSAANAKFDISKNCNFGYSGQVDPCLTQWQNGRSVLTRGPYTTSGAALAVTLKSSFSAASDPADIFILGTPGVFAGFYPGFAYDSVKYGNRWSWVVLKAHSHNNAGTVKLFSTNPRDRMKIDFRSFDTGNTTGGGDDKDVQALYEGLQWARDAFAKLIPLEGQFTEVLPGANVSTEEEVKQFIKEEAWGHHACCTCSIGADGDPNAVLDSKFRVRGVDGLRVVDASAFAKIPGTFLSVPIYMISEKAADVIINGD